MDYSARAGLELELEPEPEPPSWLAGARAGPKWNGSTTLIGPEPAYFHRLRPAPQHCSQRLKICLVSWKSSLLFNDHVWHCWPVCNLHQEKGSSDPKFQSQPEIPILTRLCCSVVDPEWFIPDPDPVLNFPSFGSGSWQKFRIHADTDPTYIIR